MTRSALLPLALALVTAVSLGACRRSDTGTTTGASMSSGTSSTTSSMSASSPASAASQ
jgi:hypothetical protein